LSTVDALPISSFLDRLGRFVGAEDTPLRDSFVADDVRAYMWHAGMLPPFTVGLGRPPHKHTIRRLRGTTVTAIHAWDNSNAGYDALTPFRMSYAENGTVGVLTIHSFDNPDGWDRFISRLVPDMRRHGSRALLIDLRLNSGGDTETSDALLSLFAHRRFRDVSSVDIRVSGVTKHSYGKERYLEIYGTDAWNSPNGTLLHQSVEWTNSMPASSTFSGRVYILDGPGTFSTAAIFAAAVQDNHAGTILGQRSGGLATLDGESFAFQLPNSRLDGTVSTKYFVRPNGGRASTDVIPDHVLPPSPPGAPTDPELDAAIAYARQHS
jgi:C-terminal processing protease CtpA/Prc